MSRISTKFCSTSESSREAQTANLNIYHQTRNKNPLWTHASENILSRFLPFCMQAKFWEKTNSSEILAVLKSPTAKIDFIDFL